MLGSVSLDRSSAEDMPVVAYNGLEGRGSSEPAAWMRSLPADVAGSGTTEEGSDEAVTAFMTGSVAMKPTRDSSRMSYAASVWVWESSSSIMVLTSLPAYCRIRSPPPGWSSMKSVTSKTRSPIVT